MDKSHSPQSERGIIDRSYRKYLDKWLELVELEKETDIQEDQYILESPFSVLIQEGKALSNMTLHSLKKDHDHILITFKKVSNLRYKSYQNDDTYSDYNNQNDYEDYENGFENDYDTGYDNSYAEDEGEGSVESYEDGDHEYQGRGVNQPGDLGIQWKSDEFITVYDQGPDDEYYKDDEKDLNEALSGFLFKTKSKTTVTISFKCKSPDFAYQLFKNIKQQLSSSRFVLVRRPNMSMFFKYNEVMKDLATVLMNVSHPQKTLLHALIFPNEHDYPRYKSKKLVIHDFKLNEDQIDAVESAISANRFYVLQGPPGTGKSTVLIEIIKQLLNRNYRVQVCSTSHISTDNLAKHFKNKKYALRLGRTDKIDPDLYKIILEDKINEQVKELKARIQKLYARNQKDHNDDREKVINELEKELRTLRYELNMEFIGNAKLIFTTINGARDFFLRKYMEQKSFLFDYIIIDEASQSPEVATWLPIMNGKNLIIAGDHMQLSVNAKNKMAEIQGFTKSLLERLLETVPRNYQNMLRIQYRMNKHINKWPSEEFYKGLLTPHQSVKIRTIKVFKRNKTYPIMDPFTKLISTHRLQYNSEVELGKSQCNPAEAALVLLQIKYLFKHYHLHQSSIGVITPYKAQKILIEKILDSYNYNRIEVQSVDGFQGREKEIIILSLVRSNYNRKLGFITDPKRMNVAYTRAKLAVIIICDKETVSHNPMINKMLNQIIWKENYDYFENFDNMLEMANDAYLDIQRLQELYFSEYNNDYGYHRF